MTARACGAIRNEPGPDVAPVLRVGEARIGFMVCEDGWNDAGQDYEVNPFQRMRDAAPDLVVSLNASPSDIGKRDLRQRVFAQASARHGLPLLYVNQVGGQDQIVFDGASFAVEPQAGIVFEARRFTEDVTTLRFENGRFLTLEGRQPEKVSVEGLSIMAFYRAQIVLGLRDYARRCGFKQAVVGSSGGIDSALTLALAVDALGNVCVATLMHGGISIVSPDGALVSHVPLPDRMTTNICFGGRDRRTAYVTLSGSGKLIAIDDWPIPGLALAHEA